MTVIDTADHAPQVTSGDLTAVNSAAQLLQVTGDGRELVSLLRRLGFWLGDQSPDVRAPEHCRPFPVEISNLTSDQIADVHSYWTSEQARVCALIGALQRQRHILVIELKRAKASAAATVLRQARDNGEKAPSSTALAAFVDTSETVITAEDKLAHVDGLIAALNAVKEAVEGFCRVASREIARRGDLLRSGVAT